MGNLAQATGTYSDRLLRQSKKMRLLARFVVLSWAIAAGVLSAAFRFGVADCLWVEIARYLPYPLYVIPAIAVVVFSWLLGRVWQAIALLAFALVTTQVMGLAVGHADSGEGRFTLMTYNVKSYLAVRHVDGFARLAWEISSHDADVLVMQDAQALTPPHALPVPFQAALGGREIYRQGQYVVASRFPLSDCRSVDMPPATSEETYVRCNLDVRGKHVTLFTTHFVSPRDRTSSTGSQGATDLAGWQGNLADRLAQAQAIANAVRDVRGPVIVAGDLNSAEDSPVVRMLIGAGLRDAFSSAAVGYGYTYGHALVGISFLRIDHILFGGAIGVRRCEVGDSNSSEHRPVIAELFVESSHGVVHVR